MRKIFIGSILLLLVWSTVSAEDTGNHVRVIWMGLLEGGRPAIEKQLGDRLTGVFEGNSSVVLADPLETARIRDRSGFADRPVVTPALAQTLAAYADHRTVVAWAKVTSINERVRRTWLIVPRIETTMALEMHFYNVNDRSSVFVGDIPAKASIALPPVFFRRVDLVTHVTPTNRAELDRQLLDQSGRGASTLVATIARSLIGGGGGGPAEPIPEEVRREKVMGAEDIFDIPVTNAKDILSPTQEPAGTK